MKYMTWFCYFLPADAGSLLPNPELPSTLCIPPPPPSFANSQSMALQASLALWRYTAEKVINKSTLCAKVIRSHFITTTDFIFWFLTVFQSSHVIIFRGTV